MREEGRKKERKRERKIERCRGKEVDSSGWEKSQKSKCNRTVQKKEKRQKSRPKEREVLFFLFYFLYQDETVKSRSNPPARAEYLRSHQCSWPH